MVSPWSTLLSSFDEVRQVLCDHGFALNVKVIRKRAYRYYAEHARLVQQAGQISLNKYNKHAVLYWKGQNETAIES
ncbi:hypothetical protein JCM12294_33000 [Desulfocicer niacini]